LGGILISIIDGHILRHGAVNGKLLPFEGDAVAALKLFQVISDAPYGLGTCITNGILAIGAVIIESRAGEGVLVTKGCPRCGVRLHGDRDGPHIGIIGGGGGDRGQAGRGQDRAYQGQITGSKHIVSLKTKTQQGSCCNQRNRLGCDNSKMALKILNLLAKAERLAFG